ncbi:MAG: HAD family hydrolase [Bacteroidales bacterium]|nr:HAD family hydrolase [Bacteroidales bacterium]MDD4822520.1 HAD family hydrolase [Bacteroidales bacterium]
MNPLFSDIKGVIFDYGGTLDTNGMHWAEVLWRYYQQAGVPIDKESFKRAYVHAERTLAKERLILPHHLFYDVLLIKVGIQIEYLIENGLLPNTSEVRNYRTIIADGCHKFTLSVVDKSRVVVNKVAKRYKTALVSNFYGNIQTILKDFDLFCSFGIVVESAVVGIRKPDPEIFLYGVRSLHLLPHEVVVVGDSFSKDIVPAKAAGCKTIWLKGEGWKEETDDSLPDAIITSIEQLTELV